MQIDLFPGEVLVGKIHSNVTAVLTVQNISLTTSFLVCQVHIQYGNLTLSLDRAASVDKSVTGSDVGVVTVLKPQQTTVSWYLFAKHNTAVDALFYVTSLNQNGMLCCFQQVELYNMCNVLFVHVCLLLVVETQDTGLGSVAEGCCITDYVILPSHIIHQANQLQGVLIFKTVVCPGPRFRPGSPSQYVNAITAYIAYMCILAPALMMRLSSNTASLYQIIWFTFVENVSQFIQFALYMSINCLINKTGIV